uniref:Putative ovule protein n=1 Tax=Solanum chacoense TaxID=4108 RepID=A0A0V0GXD5_SOLCH
MINLSGLSGRWTEKSVDILLDQRFFSIIQYNLTYMHAFSILSVVTLFAVKNLGCSGVSFLCTQWLYTIQSNLFFL